MSDEKRAYVGRIHYREDGQDYHAQAAVLCNDRADFDERLSEYLQAQGQALLWSQDVFDVLDWFRKFGRNGLLAGLARAVDETHPIALSEGRPEQSDADEESYLKIEEIENVEPLDEQFGVWPKLTVPEALQEAMFGQPEPTPEEIEQYGDDVPPMATYAILDAAKLPFMLTSYLEDSGLEYQSLFRGDAQEDLGDYAPYIVRLEEGNDFARKLFTTDKAMGLYEKELGIFIRSRASLAELRKHFRKFTRVQDEQGKWFYFRFWEGAAFGAYVSNADDNAERWFDANSHAIKYIILQPHLARATCFSYQNEDTQNAKLSPFVITEMDKTAFSKSTALQFDEKLRAYLSTVNSEFKNAPIERQQEIVKIIVTSAEKFNLRVEKAIADFAEASLLLGRPLEHDKELKSILLSDYHALDKAKWVLRDVKKLTELGAKNG